MNVVGLGQYVVNVVISLVTVLPVPEADASDAEGEPVTAATDFDDALVSDEGLPAGLLDHAILGTV